MNQEAERFKKDIIGKLNKNIAENERVIKILQKRNSIGWIENENISDK
jgi:hypothetical protein